MSRLPVSCVIFTCPALISGEYKILLKPLWGPEFCAADQVGVEIFVVTCDKAEVRFLPSFPNCTELTIGQDNSHTGYIDKRL